MEEVKTKRGKIGFGQEKILLEENYTDYFRNLYRELWEEGNHQHMITFFLLTFGLSYSIVMFGSIIFFLDLRHLIFFAASAVFVFGGLWIIQRMRGFSTDKKIMYKDIKKVKLVRGTNWLTCPRFVISYDKDGEKKRRYVAMHSHMIPGVDKRIEEIKENFESNNIEVS